MKTPELQTIILTTLASHHVTSDQLLALLNTDAAVRTIKLSKPRLHEILRRMVKAGEVEKTVEPDTRYRQPLVRYSCAEGTGIMWGWEVRRNDPGENCTHIIGQCMTEAEARTCVTALNAIDRKVRSFKTK